MLEPIINCCDQLIDLAEKKQWSSFKRKLTERERLLADAAERLDLDNPPPELYSQIRELQQKNRRLIELAKNEQKGLADVLSNFKKGDKAKSAYNQIK